MAGGGVEAEYARDTWDARRLGIYDKRLKRPRFVPFMIRTFRRFFGPKRVAA